MLTGNAVHTFLLFYRQNWQAEVTCSVLLSDWHCWLDCDSACSGLSEYGTGSSVRYFADIL